MVENYEVIPLLVLNGWLAFFMAGIHIQICIIEGVCNE